MKTKRRIVICVIGVIVYLGLVALLLTFGGCDMLAQYGNDPNMPLIEPNQIGALAAAGHAVGAIGKATGNPELIGIGILIVTIAGTLGGAYAKKKLG